MKIFKDHRVMFAACIVSLILGVLPFLYCLIEYEWSNKSVCFIFLIPCLVQIIISLGLIKLLKSHQVICKILSFIFNFTIIVVVQWFIGSFILAFTATDDDNIKENKIENYEQTLDDFENRFVEHFPQKIPIEAQNVQLDSCRLCAFGSSHLYLKFDINKNYIEDEINRHKYVNVEKDRKWLHECKNDHILYGRDMDLSDFDIYVIGDKEHDNPPEYKFQYHYGIGVNKDKNEILYYYDNPD